MASKIVLATLIVTTILLNIPGHSTEGVPVKRKVVADEEIDRFVARAHISEGTEQGDTQKTDISIEVQEKQQNQEVNTQVDAQGASSDSGKPHHNKQSSTQIEEKDDSDISNLLFLVIVICCSALGVIGLVIAGYCWYKLHQSAKSAGEADYPAYGVTGPSTKSSTITNGDRKLAQSAQMYHYQHQKQQMIAMESRANGEMKQDVSDDDSEEENEEGDYTVYECPGLAPAGEMTVKNPLFNDDQDNDPQSPAATDEK
ncbi:uncharacterized protein LOC144441127 isoform X2 [Glandiceps talaboti]